MGHPYGVYREQLSIRRLAALRLPPRSLTLVLHECKTGRMASARPRVLTLSEKESLILELLSRGQQMYGLQLVATSTGRLKPGTVYVTLGRMEEKGYITSYLEDPPSKAGGLPRRIYRPTPLGRRVLRAWTGGARRLRPEFAP